MERAIDSRHRDFNVRAAGWRVGRPWHRRGGQALVELAIVLPILMVLLLGVLQYGIINNATIVLSQLSREGARYAATHANDTTGGTSADTKIQNYLKTACTGTSISYSDLTNVSITRSQQDPKSSQPDTITVTLTYPMSNKFFVPAGFPGLATIRNYTAACTMIIQD